ncbi:uncharacterized protein LOC131937113 [Physella acuta]|uniref:uncharacterized protein LOC131937113 n=1 Tax=Physella acuta TaxID=109671 RepID=UPI0027DE5A92|nr:uncharacterized protein LOC131937113 [Physella acuta]
MVSDMMKQCGGEEVETKRNDDHCDVTKHRNSLRRKLNGLTSKLRSLKVRSSHKRQTREKGKENSDVPGAISDQVNLFDNLSDLDLSHSTDEEDHIPDTTNNNSTTVVLDNTPADMTELTNRPSASCGMLGMRRQCRVWSGLSSSVRPTHKSGKVLDLKALDDVITDSTGSLSTGSSECSSELNGNNLRWLDVYESDAETDKDVEDGDDDVFVSSDNLSALVRQNGMSLISDGTHGTDMWQNHFRAPLQCGGV